MAETILWNGYIKAVQPRIRLLRSFDERSHSYLGYSLFLRGEVNGALCRFSVGVGKTAQAKHQFRVGDEVSGRAVPVADPRKEPVAFYRASKLVLVRRGGEQVNPPPPWHGVPPDLETYRWRGHRRLATRTYNARCTTCMWGCRMPVELLIDPWDPHMEYRFETFCYGPKSCAFYVAGPARIVPGRKGMRWEEPDWLDEEETAHRSADE
ncbi:MAG: hypothetical protein JXA09_12775 [Anaerolineae bacterium]|nr:hypothetical protein [Anaerolineae bacterium]